MAFDIPRKLAALALAAAVLSASPALAGEGSRPRAVVELFTSQGCSSCPPADRLLSELIDRGDVVALSYHVDYWDYLGWRDTLASAENTERQAQYGKAFGIRSVYTPQAVVNGRTHVNGAKRGKLLGAIDRLSRNGNGLTVDLRAVEQGESIVIEVGAGTATSRKGHVVLVYFGGPTSVAIERGENSGRTVVYRNVVTDRQTAGMWHGKATRIEMPLSEIAKKGGCAVLLQEVDKSGLPGAILGATIIREPAPAPREDVQPPPASP
jgi:hypothetical protein